MIVRKVESVKKIKQKIGRGYDMRAIRIRVTWWFLFIPLFSTYRLADVSIS